MSSDWWLSKMRGQQPPQQPAPQPYSHTPPLTTPPVPRIPQVPQHTPQNAQGIQVTVENFHEAAALWQGGEGTRTETGRCPNCGSDKWFSRTNQPFGGGTGGSGGRVFTQNGVATVSPHCFDCGYSDAVPLQRGSQ